MSEEITQERVRQVLDLELGDNDSGQPTVRGYLLRLLADVWTQEEDFDGKRPFGNSNWRRELYAPMEGAGLIDGGPDERVNIAHQQADALVLAAIAALDAPRLTVTPVGYQGPAQHTYTSACDGFHEPGQQCNLPAAREAAGE